MAESSQLDNSILATRLCMACYGVGAFALVAGLAAVAYPPSMPMGDTDDSFVVAGQLSFWSAIAYLLATSGSSIWHGWWLCRRQPNFSPSRWMTYMHGLILLVSAGTLLRGPTSRALLAGLDAVLAAMVVVGALSLALQLLLNTYRLAESQPSRSPTGIRPPGVLVLSAGLITCAGLIYLETLSLPNSHPSDSVASASNAGE